MLRVFIGYDEREHRAAEVCAKTLRQVTKGVLEPEFLCASRLQAVGLLNRPADWRGSQIYDFVSQETASTRFKTSRFLTPILCQQGYALFLDCDMIFTRDPREMLLDASAHFAVNVVKHEHLPVERYKMVNQVQTTYPWKNWSSVMLFNCDHAANRRLSLRDVNERTARELHTFYWLHDNEIGDLGPEWNWLVDCGMQKPQHLGIAHMTLGGPWLPGWAGGSFDDEWIEADNREA